MTIALSSFLKQLERLLFPGHLWQSDVTSRLAAPPGTPTAGARYLVIATATGAWAGQENKIATYTGSAWTFESPAQFWLIWITGESKIYYYDGDSWEVGIVDNELLSQDNMTEYINAALEAYNHDRPDDETVDVAGDGGKYYSITTSLTYWEEDFSQVVSIEYPAATVASDEAPQILEPEDWQDDYWYNSTRYLYLPNHSPAATEYMRIKYTVPYEFSSGATAVPQQDFYAVCYKAACIACRAIATRYSQIGDSIIGADSAAHATKAGEFSSRADEYCSKYDAALGLGEFAADSNKAAGEFVDWDTAPGFPLGRDYVFHHRGLR